MTHTNQRLNVEHDPLALCEAELAEACALGAQQQETIELLTVERDVALQLLDQLVASCTGSDLAALHRVLAMVREHRAGQRPRRQCGEHALVLDAATLPAFARLGNGR